MFSSALAEQPQATTVYDLVCEPDAEPVLVPILALVLDEPVLVTRWLTLALAGSRWPSLAPDLFITRLLSPAVLEPRYISARPRYRAVFIPDIVALNIAALNIAVLNISTLSIFHKTVRSNPHVTKGRR